MRVRHHPDYPMRIGLCSRGHTRVFQLLKEALPADEIFVCRDDDVISFAADADVLIPIITPIRAEVFAAPRLKLIQQYGVGLDSVDIPAATRAGVLVANVASVGTGNAESVAELAIAHLLMLARAVPTALQRFRERKVGAPLGTCLWGSTVLILGYGGIGEEIARRLAGFGTRVVAASRHGPAGTRPRDRTVRIDLHVSADALGEVIGDADFIVVAAPASPENIGLVNDGLFARMKRGAYLVNIARGPVIDYAALLTALRTGQVAGAGLDVFWQEPFDPEDPLLQQNVIATPHIGGVTETSLRGIGAAVVANIECLRRGEIPACCVNPAAGLSRISMPR